MPAPVGAESGPDDGFERHFSRNAQAGSLMPRSSVPGTKSSIIRQYF